MKNIILCIFLLNSTIAFTQNILISKEKKDLMLEYINLMESENELAGAISMYQDGKKILNKSFGQQNLPLEIYEDLPLLYQIGSISKLFTAVLLAKLVDKSEFSFDDKLSKYFPQIQNAQKITMHHLLNHTSGLQDYVVKNDTNFYWLVNPVSHDDIVKEIIRQGIISEPGDSLRYSNSAYFLLARIAEIEYGKPYSDILNDEICKPLNLQTTFAYQEKFIPVNVAPSFQKMENGWESMNEFYFYNASGVGDIVSTPEDLNVFITALFDGRIVNKDLLNSMLPVRNAAFGKGLMKIPFYDLSLYGHGGDTYGTHSIMAYLPNEKFAFSYSINAESFPTNEFAINIMSIIFDKDFEMPSFKEYDVDPSNLMLYVGTYETESFPLDIKVFLSKNKLMAQATGQDAFTLSAIGEHNFEFRPARIKMKFNTKSGAMEFNQGGAEMIFQKKN